MGKPLRPLLFLGLGGSAFGEFELEGSLVRETQCESGRWIDALKKRGRVLKKRGRVL